MLEYTTKQEIDLLQCGRLLHDQLLGQMLVNTL